MNQRPQNSYDVIVIGGGHAGAEAAWAASSMLESTGSRVALVTMDPSRIGQMSCNPAIGGLGKGQIVREVDALGGIMGRAIDATGVMFRMLNTSRGAAVRGPRAQADKYAYAAEVQRLLSTRDNIDVVAATVDDIVVENGAVVGVLIPDASPIVAADESAIEHNIENCGRAIPVYPSAGRTRDDQKRLIRSRAVILTTGTFMRGLMHTGGKRTEGGRVDEGSAKGVSATLQKLGFELGRLKTGTPPRLARETIDWLSLDQQLGDEKPVAFSEMSPEILPAGRFPHLPQDECRITNTTAESHELIRKNLHRAPMYAGNIDAECGPRYCPSIEDKVVRFADRLSHHVFLEPESLHTNEIYCNGISTSLPIDVQEQIVRMMPGCERAEILKWGYAVEYDMVWTHQIDSTCQTKSIAGFYLAGQINCTTGYEEAAGQGLIAGLNAVQFIREEDPVRLGRDQAYIGVMLDDLVTRTPREPYRMFTSRAEHRLLLRADNADERLTPVAREFGLCCDARWNAFEQRRSQLESLRSAFDRTHVEGKTLREVARRPDTTIEDLRNHLENAAMHCSDDSIERVMTDARYDGYITRQRAEIRRSQKAERRSIPAWLDLEHVSGLRSEARETLQRFRPATMGQAARLSGVNPADLSLLAVAIKRGPKQSA